MKYGQITAAATDLYIDGQWRKAEGDRRFEVIDPATEEVLVSVADGSVADALAAVDAAARALAPWAAKLPRERAEILRNAFELVMADQQRLAELITLENGKSLADSKAEIAYSADFFRWFSEEAVRNLGEVCRGPGSGANILVQHKPAGVAVMVTPWNFPAAMGARKIAPALAAGCTCVLKPASETPLTLLALAEILERAGVPKGVVNVVPSRRSGEVVGAMLADPRVRVVSFTGSTSVGKTLLHAAADQVINPAMELGGNAPFLVFEGADVKAAVEGAMVAKMRNMGEACTAANRFYVHDSLYDAFVAGLAEAMAKLKVGHGLDEGVAVGSLVNAATRDKVESLVADAAAKGARVVVGGQRIEGKGFFYAPTVLAETPDDALCLKEEIFGPVAPIQRFATEDEAIAKANDTEYGLAAYLYVGDLGAGLRLGSRLEAGMVGLNRGAISDPAAPFGGVKQSGLGREGAHAGLMEFLETQYISAAW